MKRNWMKQAAEAVVKKNVNSACLYVLHQPELPAGAKRKFEKENK